MHDEDIQADVTIAVRVTRKLYDMIVSSDNDYVAYLEKECTYLKDFEYNSNSNIISDIVLYMEADIGTYHWLLFFD